MSERVKCKKCGQFIKSAVGVTGSPMEGHDLVIFVKMMQNLQLGDDTVRCAGCGAGLADLVIEEVP